MSRLSLVALLALACTSSGPPPSRSPEPIGDGRASAPAAPTPADAPQAGSSGDAPEISRSVGKPGGVVVLWPRIVLPRNSPGPDAETRELARRIQERVAAVVRRVAGGRDVDVRPEPERVCPRQGCQAATVGALVTRAGGGCAVLALVSGAGPSPARIVPWFGAVNLDSEQVPFREHAERQVHVKDYGSCKSLPEALTEGEPVVEEAVKRALGI
jgi:hypothetical protein